MSIGEKVREAREKQGLSLRALAEAAGISFSYLSEIENGISIPGVLILQKLAKALGVKMSALMPD